MVVLLLLLLVSLSSSSFTTWENLELPITLIYDFVLIENESILLVVEGFEGNTTRIVAVDVSGDVMTIIATEEYYCPVLEGNSYQANEFLTLSNTTVALHCQYISPGFIPWSSVYILTWDSQKQSLTVSPNYGLFKPGWSFIMPSPTYSSSLDPNHVWFWDNSISAVTVRVSAVDINMMDISSEHIFQPGLIYGSSLLSPPNQGGDTQGYVVLAQEYVDMTVLTKYSLNSWEKMGALPFNEYTFAVSGTDKAGYIQTGGQNPSYLTYAQCDYSMWICGPPLNLTFPMYVSYPGDSGWPASAFYGSFAYFVVQIPKENSIDYISVLHQVQLVDVHTAPKLLDAVKYHYEYSHNLLATESWVYTDTDGTVISRIRIQD